LGLSPCRICVSSYLFDSKTIHSNTIGEDLLCFNLNFIVLKPDEHRFVLPVFPLQRFQLAIGPSAEGFQLLRQKFSSGSIVRLFAPEVITVVPALYVAIYIWGKFALRKSRRY